jgi:hypothetical protein
MIKNYYFILGVPKNASNSDIKGAYEAKKRLAERDAMEAAMLGEAAEAYECLINPSRRLEYDRTMTTTPARPADNTQEYSPPESRVAVELEFKNLRTKHNSKKKIFKNLTVIVSLLVFAVIGIRLSVRHFAEDGATAGVPALTQTLNTLGVPEEEKPFTSALRTYEMKTGGIVTKDRAPCRVQPSGNAAVVTAMRKDTIIFVTKEIRRGDGAAWYYVFNSQFEGWASGADIRIYNKY